MITKRALGDSLVRYAFGDASRRFSHGMDRVDRAYFLSAFHKDATIAVGAFIGDPVALYDCSSVLNNEG